MIFPARARPRVTKLCRSGGSQDLRTFAAPFNPKLHYTALPLMASWIPKSATSTIIILLISILVTFTMQPFDLLKQTVFLLAASTYAADLTAWEQIHQVIHTYPLAIDGKNYDLFEKVSTPSIIPCR